MKNLYIFILTITLGGISFAQKTQEELSQFVTTASEKDLVSESAMEMTNGRFYHADLIVDKLLEMKPESSNYLYRKGYIYSKLNKKPDQILAYLGKVNGKLTRSFDVFSTKDYASVDTYYYMGLAYQRLEKYDSSEYYFQQYLDNSLKTSYLYADAQTRIAQNKNVKAKIEGVDNDIQVINLGENINTEYPDFGSVVNSNDGRIYYTSRRPWDAEKADPFVDTYNGFYPEDIYLANAAGNTWEASNKLAINKAKYNDAMVTMIRSNDDEDGSVFIYTDSIGRGDIMIAQINEDGEFTNPQLLDIDGINVKKYWEPSFYVANNGNRIYFSSDRKGGYGGLDLYFIDKNTDGSWTDPVNLGPGINTASDEDAPTFTVDGKYFIYASNGPKSMGGYDLFYSKVITNNDLSEGKPLSYPLNSTSDDIYYNSSQDGLTGYITSDRLDSYGEKDIYEVSHNYLGLEKIRYAIITLVGEDGKDLTNEKTRFTCLDCNDNTPYFVEPRKRDDKVISSLEPCHKYQVEYLRGEEVESTDTLVSDCDLAYQHITFDHQYGPIVIIEDSIIVDKVLADYKKGFGYNLNKPATSDKEYKDAVKKAKEFLKNDINEQIYIYIYSSASTVPTQKYQTNENLAKLRANNMMKQLLSEFNEDQLSRLDISIKEMKVDGPEYDNDAANRSKYAPYQFVRIEVVKKEKTAK